MIGSVAAVWSAFWGELNTPDSFHARPYAALTNGAGHILLGLWCSAAISLAYCLATGEMPYRWTVWLLVTALYLWLIERIKQDWQKADSVIDGGFVSLGAAVPLAALKEVSFHPKVVLEAQPVWGLVVLAAVPIALAAYVTPRLMQWKRQGGGAIE